jgi:ABC-type branched-subunit amino acid transport system substrate-binding protein
MRRRWLVPASLLLAFALVAAACGDDDATTTSATAATTTTAGTEATTTTEAPMDEVAFDVGVTPAPCPDAENEGNGCIYLGVITDLSGPFAGFGGPITNAQTDFWSAINADGGLDGWDVIISLDNQIDAGYDLVPAPGPNTANAAATLATRVLALNQLLGTPPFQSARGILDENNMVTAPAGWWSGLAFPEEDLGLVLESGAPYCFEGMNGMTFMTQALESTEFSWALVAFDSDYGQDYAAGVKIAASQLGLPDPVIEIDQVSFAAGGEGAIASTVAALLPLQPNVIVLVTGPTELAAISGGLAGQGFTDFAFLGASPTWHPVLLGEATAALVPLWSANLFVTYPWGPWDTDSPGHAAMRAAAEANDREPNPGYGAGWTWSYPIRELLEQAIATNDLTRANVRAMAGALEGIDYQGILPERGYAGTPGDDAERSSWVVGVDPTANGGVTPLADAFTSPIAAAYPFDGPCYVIGA